MLNSHSSGEGVNWVSNAGARFGNMMWRSGGLLTTKIDNRKLSEVGRGLDDEDRFLRIMLTLNSYPGEGNKKSDGGRNEDGMMQLLAIGIC